MCGIWAMLGTEYVPSKHQKEFLKIAGRGPDLTIISRVSSRVWLGFHRLAIPGDSPSEQPICADGLSVVCNGEIYNHLALKDHSLVDNSFVRNGGSDCAAIIHAFRSSGNDLRRCCASLDGVFAFAMVDRTFLYLGRDPIGVRPLFYGFTGQGLLIGSEIKSIEKLCKRISFFPPGCCAQIPLGPTFSTDQPIKFQRFFQIPSIVDCAISVFDAKTITHKLLIEAVEKRLMGNRQFGFMLSGGLDSSLVAALATRFLHSNDVSASPTAFSVGFEDSPDLENARRMAEYLGIAHHVLVISPQDCVEAIPEVIYSLETFDPLVVRCGVAHFLLCKHIAAKSEVKVLLSGEGADELFGSYAYMQQAPNAHQLHQEIHRRLQLLHQYDVLRCDRCTSCHGLEIRVPFLDKKFVSFVARLPPSFKHIPQKIEKYILRSAFQNLLPDEVLWRSKEGFSEALGKVDLGEVLEKHAHELIGQTNNLAFWDTHFANRALLFPLQTPQTKEEFWYRMLFEQRFNLRKLDTVIHTKVYRTAAWQIAGSMGSSFSLSDEEQPSAAESSGSGDESKENHPLEARAKERGKNAILNGNQLLLNGMEERENKTKRIRRRSTGSAKLAGVA
uniref:Glutamine-dependent asparagine synthetase n=1 Tax=Globodera rostochiensis TaxID=31243 RepID=A0A914GVI4_GLORO